MQPSPGFAPPLCLVIRIYLKQILIRYSRVCVSYQDFLDKVAANKEATEPRVPSVNVVVITLIKVL